MGYGADRFPRLAMLATLELPMSIEERDTAQRCDRCQRFILGTRQVAWVTDTGLEESVALTWRLCRRCRTEVSSHIQHMIREAVTW